MKTTCQFDFGITVPMILFLMPIGLERNDSVPHDSLDQQPVLLFTI